MSSWLFPQFDQVATAKLTGQLRECKTIRMTHLDVNADHSMMRPAEKMLIILFAGILLISCASGDNQSTMAALGSGAVFTQKTKPNPAHDGKTVTSIRYGSLNPPACSWASITLRA